MSLLYWIDLAGVGVFAISGSLAAMEKKFDVFGVAVLAGVTAVGGGTVRDLLVGAAPVLWLKDPSYLWMIVFGLVASILFYEKLKSWRRAFFIFDTLGLALYTMMGLQKTLNLGFSPLSAILMGTFSAVFGGVLRDILCADIPLLFRKEIYATISILGGCMYMSLHLWLEISELLSMGISMLLIISVRTLVVVKNWSLPPLKNN